MLYKFTSTHTSFIYFFFLFNCFTKICKLNSNVFSAVNIHSSLLGLPYMEEHFTQTINRMNISAFNQMDSGTFHERRKLEYYNNKKRWEAWVLRWHYYKGRGKRDRQWGKSNRNTDLIFVICRRTNSSITHTHKKNHHHHNNKNGFRFRKGKKEEKNHQHNVATNRSEGSGKWGKLTITPNCNCIRQAKCTKHARNTRNMIYLD